MSQVSAKCLPKKVFTAERCDAGFHSSVWEDYFLDSAYSPVEKIPENIVHKIQEHNKMKADVRDILLDDVRVFDKLELIDQMQRLAISYHFEEEIEQILNNIYLELCDDGHGLYDDDLHATSLLFRLLRQQGYNISCDIFDKFKDSKGKWKESSVNIGGDVRGLLSLYEASHMRIHGEDTLDEALIFTVSRLQSLLDNGNLDPSIAPQVSLALKWSLRKGLPRLSARHYIQIFQDETAAASGRGSNNNKLLVLGFAKLDFNLLQKQHQKELHVITRWWKDLEVQKNYPFARDRVTESYFWILGVYFEPQHSLARYMLAKVFGLASILDDMYDAYGTIQELDLLTKAINEWDIRAMKKLPDYMQVYYKAFLDVFKEIEGKLVDQGRSYRFVYVKEAMKNLATAYFKEAQWFHQKYTPTIEEYMSLGKTTSGYELMTLSSHLGMGDVATKDVFDWLFSDPKVMRASNLQARLMNDISSRKVEQERGHVSSAVECYMKQHQLTEEKALERVRKQIEDAWKDINEECLNPAAAPMPILTRILNLSRVLEVMYHDDKDAYSNSKAEMKDYIKSLLVNPISA